MNMFKRFFRYLKKETHENKTVNFEDSFEFVETLALAISNEPVAVAKLLAIVTDKTYTAVQRVPFEQMKRYLEGVKRVEELGKGCTLSDKLFSNPAKRNENAMRVYKTVISVDTEKKIDYLVNATRSMLLGLIDVEMMFRIFQAILESLPEDLDYLSTLVQRTGPFEGDIRILALARTGLVISAGINANADIEKQDYLVSSLGYSVDQFALSVDDESRCEWYRNREMEKLRLFSSSSDRDIKELLDKQKKELIDASTLKWNQIPSFDEQQNIIWSLTANKEAIALLVYAARLNGQFVVTQDISHVNPYVEIGEYVLPGNDDSRESATWIDAVKLLNTTGVIDCVDSKSKIYKLTKEGWEKADYFIEEYSLSNEDLRDIKVLLQVLNEIS